MIAHFTRIISLIAVFSISVFSCFSQTKSVGNKIRTYNYPMNPRQHPDDARRYVKPPDAGTFGNKIQFMAVRYVDDAYMKTLDNYTVKYDLGDVLWPDYPLLYRKDLPEIVQEIKKRNLYIFDIWGYVPGSGPGGYWQAFVPPQKSLELIKKEMDDHWLGMDNGEQDGRYVGGFASQLVPLGGSWEKQYLNFQNHFQGLTDRLGNRMSTLVSLNFGHYFLKEGVYTMIGAETAQGLPNGQLGNPDEFEKNLATLKNLKMRMLFVAAPEKDIYETLWNVNKPIRDFPSIQELKQLLLTHPGSILVLDGIYDRKDEEYLDIKFLENL